MELNLTTVIVAVNVLVSLAAFNNQNILSKLMFNPYQVRHRNEYYRVITHAFIHGDFLHLLFNMYVLYSFGGLIEQIFTDRDVFLNLFPDLEFWGVSSGYLYYVLLYFGGLMVATLPALKNHSDDPGYNSLGASGAVSAVVLAIILLLPTMNLRLFFVPIDIPAFIIGGAYLGYEYYMSKRGRTGIAHDAHFWGAIFGLVLLLILRPQFGLYFLLQVGSFLGVI
jgi:membrane associated rhomboid family serine protease